MSYSLGALIFSFAMGIFVGLFIFNFFVPEDLDRKVKDALDREDYKEAARLIKKIKAKAKSSLR